MKYKFILIFIFVLNTSCKKPAYKVFQTHFFGKNIIMYIPSVWDSTIMPNAPLNDMHEEKHNIVFGNANKLSLTMKVKSQQFYQVHKISADEVIDIFYKNRKAINLIAVAVDTVNNKIIIDYLGKRNINQSKLFYLRHVIIIKDNMWTSFDFQGLNKKCYRDTIEQITNSIKITTK